MRFMVIVKANKDSEAGVPPSTELVTAMSKFNAGMVKAGVMLAAEGLHPSSKGARIRFSGGSRTVTDGPFTGAKDLVAGFWLIEVKSKEEAIEWMKRCPAPFGEDQEGEIEIRQLSELSDLPPEVQEAAMGEVALRAEIERRKRA